MSSYIFLNPKNPRYLLFTLGVTTIFTSIAVSPQMGSVIEGILTVIVGCAIGVILIKESDKL